MIYRAHCSLVILHLKGREKNYYSDSCLCISLLKSIIYYHVPVYILAFIFQKYVHKLNRNWAVIEDLFCH